MESEMTKNVHLEHPEDTILNGDLSVLDWFVTPYEHLSVKMDGSPAVVFGTNPENGRFFVGTKSVFNKKKIKICYTEADVFALYDEVTQTSLIEILCACLKYLPRISGVVQADFIGFGGSDEYTPNTITYKFPEVVRQTIILAPHTFYYAPINLRDAVSEPLTAMLDSTDFVKFVQPKSYIIHNQESFFDVEEICAFVRQMSTMVNFVDDKEVPELKKQINVCIREGRQIDPHEFECDPHLIELWLLVRSIKEDCLYLCRNNGPDAYIGQDRIDSEGYVMFNKYGMYKLVNREVFSRANFSVQNNWHK